MQKNCFVLKGDILYSKNSNELTYHENHYVVCENGYSKGIFEEIPNAYKNYDFYDHTGKLIIPGLIDLHVHAPQYSFRGIGMDLELLDWLETYTFKEEQKYDDLDYAKKAYSLFCRALRKSGTTRACIFGTIHVDATLNLMEQLHQTGLQAYVGKVNMDRNSPPRLCEENSNQSLYNTEKWLAAWKLNDKQIQPMITPRFTPSCSDELMQGLGRIAQDKEICVQSHLSENRKEVEWVHELCPDCSSYAETYDRYGLFGTQNAKAIMAHCVHVTESEIMLMRDRGTYVAHCPQSNVNLSSGIAPIRTFLQENVHVGLGTDVAAGHSISIFDIIVEAIQCSKMYWALVDDTKKTLCFEEAFYLATKGGGSFFGKVGSFEAGYEFDALVIDDVPLETCLPLSLKERLERYTYSASNEMICDKYVAGIKIDLS